MPGGGSNATVSLRASLKRFLAIGTVVISVVGVVSIVAAVVCGLLTFAAGKGFVLAFSETDLLLSHRTMSRANPSEGGAAL